jgi:glucose-6-phosphate 1-dehydrogenase
MVKKSVREVKPPPAPPCILVIFGARGDLTKRLLIPSIYNLAHEGLLDDNFKILGVDHGDCDDAGLRELLGDFIKTQVGGNGKGAKGWLDAKTWSWVEERLFYLKGDFVDDGAYAQLSDKLAQMGGGSVIFYLATAPRFFGEIVERVGKSGLGRAPRGAFRRVVIEKPFGTDLASAKALNRRILKSLDENQIYRIDHFLGKETVRNIMVTRFGNGIFEPLWSRLHIDHIQITAAETVGVEDRGGYYDQAGALRDMIPSHLFQLLALTTMEPPNTFDADAVRGEMARLTEAITHQTKSQALENSVRGQYRAGEAGGKPIVGYRKAPNVAADSRTETYAALKLTIDNWRWAGVPIYLRTGKAMSGRNTEVAIQFKPAPKSLFGEAAGVLTPNVLVLQIQPNEGISLQFDAKQPGPDIHLKPVQMDFRYADYFRSEPATGYETLIYDVLIGDQTLFKRADDIEFAWAAVMPFLNAWETGGEVHGYAAGEDGPAAAGRMLARDGRAWRPVED